MREICTSGTVGGEGGNLLAYPALRVFHFSHKQAPRRSGPPRPGQRTHPDERRTRAAMTSYRLRP
jgi:hypothetical protein